MVSGELKLEPLAMEFHSHRRPYLFNINFNPNTVYSCYNLEGGGGGGGYFNQSKLLREYKFKSPVVLLSWQKIGCLNSRPLVILLIQKDKVIDHTQSPLALVIEYFAQIASVFALLERPLQVSLLQHTFSRRVCAMITQ